MTQGNDARLVADEIARCREKATDPQLVRGNYWAARADLLAAISVAEAAEWLRGETLRAFTRPGAGADESWLAHHELNFLAWRAFTRRGGIPRGRTIDRVDIMAILGIDNEEHQ